MRQLATVTVPGVGVNLAPASLFIPHSHTIVYVPIAADGTDANPFLPDILNTEPGTVYDALCHQQRVLTPQLWKKYAGTTIPYQPPC